MRSADGIEAYVSTAALVKTGQDIGNPDVPTVVNGNNAFALNLYARLSETDSGNLFFSPSSISTALAMTYAGANGETASQMAEVFHFTGEPESLCQAFADLEALLKAVQAKEHILLSIANALWAQAGYPFLQEFLELAQPDRGR